jgi:hypothetical protein
MVVIVPPQAYDQIAESLGYPAGFLDFYMRGTILPAASEQTSPAARAAQPAQ